MQIGEDRRQIRRRDGAVDEQGFGRTADAGAPHLGVEHDAPGFVHVGGTIDVGVAQPFEMGDNRDAALALYPSISERPPRGTITSMRSAIPSISATAARFCVGTSCTDASGKPAEAMPRRRAASMTRDERKLPNHLVGLQRCRHAGKGRRHRR